MKLHEKIYYYRKKAGLSQDALAEKLGVSRQAISKWETAESVPETGKLLALASALGVTVDTLLSEDGPEEARGAKYDAGTFVPGMDRDGGAQKSHSFRRSVKRWGWLSGLAVSAFGAYFVFEALLAKLAVSSMLNMINFDGALDTTFWVNGEETSIGSFMENNPVSAMSTAWLIVGAVLIIGGIALAVFLKRRGAK